MKKNGCKPGNVRIGGICIPCHCKEFIDYHGATNDYTSIWATLIAPDGKKIGNEYEQHTCMVDEYPDLPKEYNGLNKYEQLNRLMDECHFIRSGFDPQMRDHEVGSSLWIESIHKPTPKQIEALIRPFNESTLVFLLAERTKNMKSVCSIEPAIPKPIDIQKFVSRCWQ